MSPELHMELLRLQRVLCRHGASWIEPRSDCFCTAAIRSASPLSCLTSAEVQLPREFALLMKKHVGKFGI